MATACTCSSTHLEYFEELAFHDIHFRVLLRTSNSHNNTKKKSKDDKRLL